MLPFLAVTTKTTPPPPPDPTEYYSLSAPLYYWEEWPGGGYGVIYYNGVKVFEGGVPLNPTGDYERGTLRYVDSFNPSLPVYYYAVKKKTFVLNYSLPNNYYPGYNLRDVAISQGWDQVRPLQATFNVAAGVSITGGAFADLPGISTGSGFPAGSTLRLNNAGYVGGGTGVSDTNPGLLVQYPITVNNTGTLSGGPVGQGSSTYYAVYGASMVTWVSYGSLVGGIAG